MIYAEPPLATHVAAVIVTYQPVVPRLRALLDALALQHVQALVVDNGSDGSFWRSAGLEAHASFIPLGQNRGIAAAQNIGTRAALRAGAKFVLLLDQDSVPAPEMVSRLVDGWHALTTAGNDLAGVGPRMLGATGASGFIRFGRFGYRRANPAPSERWVCCDMLMASGTLISAAAFARVGEMDESLFIDKVDTEWCLRASALGMKLFGVSDATMEHTLGDERARAWIFGWRRFAVHQPFRYYYIIRNSALVWRMPHATLRWRTADGIECLKALVYFGLASNRRWSNLKMMAEGLVDGLRGVSGPMRC